MAVVCQFVKKNLHDHITQDQKVITLSYYQLKEKVSFSISWQHVNQYFYLLSNCKRRSMWPISRKGK